MSFNSQAIKHRALLYRAIREFFDSRGYLEADTPILCPHPIPEASIELFRTERLLSKGERVPLFLLPSPEVWLKRLLASGAPSLYQIGRCFRNGEQIDRWHRLEFTMLEWYRLEASAERNLREIQLLLTSLAPIFNGASSESLTGPIRRMSMEEAFRTFAGFSLEADLKNAGLSEIRPSDPDYTRACLAAAETLAARLSERNLPAGEKSDRNADDLFHRLFLSLVEDELPIDRPLALCNWPALVPTLARRLPGTPWSERWELYIRGIEVANCYGEEDSKEQLEAYWSAEMIRKSQSQIPIPFDNSWPKEIAGKLKACSGVAVGLDRLLALLRGDESLEGLDLFPINDMIAP